MQISNSAVTQVDQTPSGAGSRRRRVGFAAAGLLVLLTLLAAGFIPRLLRASQAEGLANEHKRQLPVVLTVQPHAAPPTSELVLPGNIEAVYVAALYARANGYVKRRYVDIGQKVGAGQLLAEIEAPEIDQELAQSRAALGQTKAAYQQARANLYESQSAVNQTRASLEQAQANQEIAKTTDSRWSRLVDKGVLPKQQGDEKRSAYHARAAEVAVAEANIQTANATVVSRQASIDAAKANIAAAQADVRRLEQMVSFERVVAPFDGVITERKIERGDLVAAGNGGGQTRLFSIAQADILRIQTHVPQAYAEDIQDGQTAQVEVRGGATPVVTGKVVRSANALDAQSRTLLTEVQVNNHKGLLLPGMYANVKFVLPRSKSLILIPADTLVVNGNGTRVVTVGADRKAHYKTVEVGRDLGSEIEVTSGLNGNEQLVSNPTDALSEGQSVELRTSTREAAAK